LYVYVVELFESFKVFLSLMFFFRYLMFESFFFDTEGFWQQEAGETMQLLELLPPKTHVEILQTFCATGP